MGVMPSRLAKHTSDLISMHGHTLKLAHALPVQCDGINHMDFTANGRYAIATCEYSGKLVKIDIAKQTVVDYLALSSVQPLVIGPLTFRCQVRIA